MVAQAAPIVTKSVVHAAPVAYGHGAGYGAFNAGYGLNGGYGFNAGYGLNGGYGLAGHGYESRATKQLSYLSPPRSDK